MDGNYQELIAITEMKKEIETIWKRMDEQKDFTKIALQSAGDIRVINANIDSTVKQQIEIKILLDSINQKQSFLEKDRQAIIDLFRQDSAEKYDKLETRVEALELKPGQDAIRDKRQLIMFVVSTCISGVLGFVIAQLLNLI